MRSTHEDNTHKSFSDLYGNKGKSDLSMVRSRPQQGITNPI